MSGLSAAFSAKVLARERQEARLLNKTLPLRLLPVDARRGEASTSQRYALLLRGEAYRWGCDSAGVTLQMAAVESHITHIVQPLEQKGHTVRVFIAYDHRVCKQEFWKHMTGISMQQHLARKNASNVIYRENSPDAMSALLTLFGDRRVALAGKLGNVKDQPDSISGSLRLFSLQKTTNKGDGFIQSLHRMQVPSQHQSTPASISGVVGDRLDRPENFDFLIVSRYDVRLLSPIISWPCYDQPLQVSAASMCEPVAWSRFKCIADHFWIVPKLFIPSYTELIGFRLNFSHYTSCCFSKRCLQKAGHGCYNVFEHYWGEPRLGFCWPQPKASIAEPNPHYQCCRHGKAAVVDVGDGKKS